MFHPFPHASRPMLCGQPSAEPKFHSRRGVEPTNALTHARARAGGPQPGSRSLAPEMAIRGSANTRASVTTRAHAAPPDAPLNGVMPPELLVPTAISHGPRAHRAKPVAHAATTRAMSLGGMAMPKPLAPAATWRPKKSPMRPCLTFVACSQPANSAEGNVTSSGYTSLPRT